MKKPELIIMYTWDINGYYDNKVCGHMYEIIDYYFILKDHFDTKIIFPKEYNLDEVLSKYNITIEEKIELSDSIIPRPKSGIVKTRGGNGLVLITDGNLGNFKGIIHGIPVQFSCGKLGLIPKDKKEWFLLHDTRLGHPEELFENYSINPPLKIMDYNKKIYPIKENKIKSTKHKSYLFYLTENCKFQTPKELQRIIDKLNPNISDEIYIVCDYFFDIKELNITQKIHYINIKENPIDLFSLDFTDYVYTPVKRQWDCSNRLIVECSWNGRNVLNFIDYNDRALEYRLLDISKGKNSKNLILNKDDEIIAYLNFIYTNYKRK